MFQAQKSKCSIHAGQFLLKCSCLATALCLFVTLAADPAAAQTPNNRRNGAAGNRQGGGKVKQKLKQFDANGDGRLDEQEREAAIQSMVHNPKPRLKQRMDTNGDGVIDASEEQAFRQKIQKAFQRAGGAGGRTRRQR